MNLFKKCGLSILTIVLMCTICSCGLFQGDRELYPMPTSDFENWGYVDRDGDWIIEPKYIDINIMMKHGVDTREGVAKNFCEGLAAFMDNETGLYGYIDKTGDWAIEPQYTYAGDFSEGYAVVSKPEWKYYMTYDMNDMSQDESMQQALYGYIDSAGRTAIKPRYAYAEKFTGEVAWVKEVENVRLGDVVYCEETPGNQGIYGPDGEYYSMSFQLSSPRWQTKHINGSGVEVNAKYPDNITSLHDNRCLYYDDIEGLYGYYDESGEVVIEAQFDEAKDFSEGYAAVEDDYEDDYGYIDVDGNYVIQPKYDEACSFVNGLAFVVDYGKDVCGYIDRDGDWVIKGKVN